jgi:drug/metabolite transporter (DMT)-like permease
MTPNSSSHGMVTNWLILITLGVIWGASFLGVELALTGFGPITLAAGRVSAAALILLVVALACGDGLPRFQTATSRRIWLHCLGMALFTNAIPFCLLSWGQQVVTSGFAGISMAVVPLFVLPLSHFLIPGELMSRIKIIGFLFGFAGVVLLIGGDKILVSAAPSPLMFTAQLACITASSCYAIGSIITRLCPPVSALSFAAAGLTAWRHYPDPCRAFDRRGTTYILDTAFAGLAYLAVFPTAIATILLTVLVRRAGTPIFIIGQLSSAGLGGGHWRACS